MSRRLRAILAVTGALLAAVLVVGAGTYALTHAFAGPGKPRPVAGCTATALGASFGLDLDQARNAATIAAIGKQRGLPDHAVTVAIATALQESKLQNLSSGDRDSVGLFQQRPSQGWGPPAKLQDPRYATARFYARLVTVPGWRTIPVTQAAQLVQRSAAPDAYGDWEPQARTIAAALTGEAPAAFTCRFTDRGTTASEPLAAAMTAELGSARLDTAVDAAAGWTTAGWLVANADAYRIDRISFGGRTWTRATAAWRTDPKGAPTVVALHRTTA